jgi:putative ABC transport system permease protein
MPVIVKPWTIMVSLGFSIGVGLFFGVYPAKKAAELDPIKALHYE